MRNNNNNKGQRADNKSLHNTAIFHFSPRDDRVSGGAVTVTETARLRTHYHQVCPYARPAHIWSYNTAGIAQSPFHRQCVPFWMVCRLWRRQWARRAETGTHSLVVTRRHLKGNIGNDEQLVKCLIDLQILFSGRLHEDASGILTLAVCLSFFCSDSPKTMFNVIAVRNSTETRNLSFRY